MENSNKKKPQNINLELDEKVAEGIYSNLVVINHSHAEFVFDFITMLPGIPKARVKSRIILTPQHAKGFLRALQDNIEKFESVNGSISENEQAIGIPLFGPTGEA